MKRYLTYLALGLMVSLAFVSYKDRPETGNGAAEVNRVNGLYVFTDCYPVQQYDIIGEVKIVVSFSSPRYQVVKGNLIRRVQKDYPTADAVILYPSTGGPDKATAIKFK